MAEADGTQGLSLRDIMLEMRSDIRSLNDKIDKIDREGSLGTKSELADHESRLRILEGWRWKAIGAIAASSGVGVGIQQILGG